MQGDLQYIADCLLIDKLCQMDAALEKRADFSEMAGNGLSGAAEAIASFVKSNVDFSSPKAAGMSLIKILGPGILFRINPIIGGAISVIAKMFHIDIPSIWDNLMNPIKDKIKDGIPIQPGELKTTLTTDAFADVRVLIRNGELLKISQWRARAPSGGYAIFPPKNVPFIQKMFGFLGPNKSRNIIEGFLMWFLKTALLSAGLMAVSGGIAKMIEPNKPVGKQLNDPAQQGAPGAAWKTPEYMSYQNTAPATTTQQSLINGLQPSGKGEQFHANDANTAWLVPLTGDVRNTVLQWATSVYPELQGQEGLIEASPKFNRIVNIMQDNVNDKSPNYLMMPAGYNKIIDIVNSFVGDVKRN